jgi:hypothetical protein
MIGRNILMYFPHDWVGVMGTGMTRLTLAIAVALIIPLFLALILVNLLLDLHAEEPDSIASGGLDRRRDSTRRPAKPEPTRRKNVWKHRQLRSPGADGS